MSRPERTDRNWVNKSRTPGWPEKKRKNWLGLRASSDVPPYRFQKKTKTFGPLCFPNFLRDIFGLPLITISRNMKKYHWQADVWICWPLGMFSIPRLLISKLADWWSQDKRWGQIDCEFNSGFAASVHQSERRFRPLTDEYNKDMLQWLNVSHQPSVSTENKTLNRSQTVKIHPFYFLLRDTTNTRHQKE